MRFNDEDNRSSHYRQGTCFKGDAPGPQTELSPAATAAGGAPRASTKKKSSRVPHHSMGQGTICDSRAPAPLQPDAGHQPALLIAHLVDCFPTRATSRKSGSFQVFSNIAQRKSDGLITRRPLDRDQVLLTIFLYFFAPCFLLQCVKEDMGSCLRWFSRWIKCSLGVFCVVLSSSFWSRVLTIFEDACEVRASPKVTEHRTTPWVHHFCVLGCEYCIDFG